VGWIKDMPPGAMGAGFGFLEPWCEDAAPGAVPAFRFPWKEEDALSKLPDPGVPFALDFHCSDVEDAWLKGLARFKRLQSLNLGGSRKLRGAGLKHLTELKSLRALYLFYTPVTDAGVQGLAELTNLQVLDLTHTKVTGVGLKELAGLKNLRVLNLCATYL